MIARQAKRSTLKAIGGAVIIIIPAVLSFAFGRAQEQDNRRYENLKTSASEVLESAQSFATYRTVDWDKVRNSRVDNYSCDFEARKVPEFREPIDQETQNQMCNVWDDMAAAQDEFRRRTVSGRVAATPNVVQALERMEAGFSDVFVAVMQDVWYSRSVPDNYNEVMGTRFSDLESVIRQELTAAG